MKRTLSKKITINYTLLAFLLPFIGMCAVMIVRGFEPFGKVSMLFSDMYHQYYPFFVNFRKAILSGDSLLYNWSIAMGIEYLGLIAYYLASPLNLLSILVPEAYLLEYFSLLAPIKMGLAGMFFAIFLKKTFEKDDISIAVFGALYGLCAWALGYHWNIMWVDTFALLPLVVLGAVSLLERRKFLLYTLTLFLSVLINYYIGFFVCIFMVLVFICYEICCWKGFKKFFCDLGVMALYSAIAIAMTAFRELPAYAALQNTQSSINSFPKDFRLNIADENTWKGLLDAMRQVAGNMNGAIAPSYKEGLPNLYCGVVANLLAFLFLTYKDVRLRDKLCCVFLLLFFNVSFIIRQLDYIWHGFHFTNMIPYRFSFLYSFVLLYMAYRAYLLRDQLKLWQVAVAAVLAIGLCFCVEGEQELVYWVFNILFLTLYIAILVCPVLAKLFVKTEEQPQNKKAKKKLTDYLTNPRLSAGVMLVVICVEAALSLTNFGADFVGTTVTNYPKGTEQAASIIRYMQESENSLFYRTETTHSQTLNDGALNGYNGISAFTSSANVNVTKFMKALGYGAKDTYNRYCFEESSPVSNLFLNLKYMLERDGKVEDNNYFRDAYHYGNVHLLENDAWLPLGFLAESQLADVDFQKGGNLFDFQNELFTATTGIPKNVWRLTDPSILTISGINVTPNGQPQTGYAYYTTTASSGTVTYRYDINATGLFCINLNLSKKNSFSVWKDGVELFNETYSIPQSLSVCQVRPGDVIEIKLTCKANEKGSITIQAGILEDTVFRAGYDLLAASTFYITEFKNTCVTGTINCNRDGLMYTSIPQNGNWTATVDGEPAEIVLVGDTMIGIPLTEGAHEIVFTYHNSAFTTGCIITLVSTLVFLWLYLSIYQPDSKIMKILQSLLPIKERRESNDKSVKKNSGEVSGSENL